MISMNMVSMKMFSMNMVSMKMVSMNMVSILKMKMEGVDESRANDGRESEDAEREDLSISTSTSIDQSPPSISSPLRPAQDGGQEVSVGKKFQVVRILNLHRLPT